MHYSLSYVNMDIGSKYVSSILWHKNSTNISPVINYAVDRDEYMTLAL